jgi:hypothetical protein
MTDEESIILLKKAIDNVSKALDRFYKEIPKYLRTEMLHPKKKPRGSIRRKRKEVITNDK